MSRRRPTTDQWREGLGFWLIVFLICIVAGVISYQAGKNWVGRRLAEVNLKASRPQLPAEQEDDTAVVELPEPGASGPPLTPQVTIEEREPTAAEKMEVEVAARERQVRAEPQDGAQLNVEREEAAPAADVNEGGYVVTAGSYTDSANAQRVIEQLTDKGYHPFVTEVEKEGVVYRRVNVAVFDDRSQAEELRNELQKSGFVSGVMPR